MLLHQDDGRADSRFAPSQWEIVLLCNVSHWLGASLESALWWYDMEMPLYDGYPPVEWIPFTKVQVCGASMFMLFVSLDKLLDKQSICEWFKMYHYAHVTSQY